MLGPVIRRACLVIDSAALRPDVECLGEGSWVLALADYRKLLQGHPQELTWQVCLQTHGAMMGREDVSEKHEVTWLGTGAGLSGLQAFPADRPQIGSRWQARRGWGSGEGEPCARLPPEIGSVPSCVSWQGCGHSREGT